MWAYYFSFQGISPFRMGMGNYSMFFLLGFLALLVILIMGAVLFRRNEAKARSEAEREVYSNMEGQITSMLLQAGGSLTQDRIRENLDIPVGEVGKQLEIMEKHGCIRREWLPLEYTFRVHRIDVDCEQRSQVSEPGAQTTTT
jgi:hypothetical protein